MSTVSMLYGKLDELAPFRTQEKWDNSGLLAGAPDTEVTKALLVLDIKDADYFREGGAPNQHGGGNLFAQDPEIMGWLFGQ